MRIRRRYLPYGTLDSRMILDDQAASGEALRITPSDDRLKAGLARRLPLEGVDLDADPADLH